MFKELVGLMHDINIIDKPDDRTYKLASVMTGLRVEDIKQICGEDKNKCGMYPVRCITTKCSALEQCYGIQILSKYE
jgi:hypothetical protein